MVNRNQLIVRNVQIFELITQRQETSQTLELIIRDIHLKIQYRIEIGQKTHTFVQFENMIIPSIVANKFFDRFTETAF